tara:strand:- start:1062 stop:1721 length:660 start_codon:yes stop_codon:yes gene_type:complete
MANSVGSVKPIVTDGLVFCVDALDIDSYPRSGTAWTDLAGSTDLTFSGATFDSAYPAINFDGSNDTITCSSINCGSIWSQQCYFRPTNQSSGGYGYFNLGWNAISEGGAIDGVTKRLYIYNGDAQNISDSTFETDIWYNIAWVFNTTDNTIKVYVNGVLDKTTSISGTFDFTTFTGLGRFTGTTHSLNGKLANFIIYNRELSASEVLQNFNAHRHRFGV